VFVESKVGSIKHSDFVGGDEGVDGGDERQLATGEDDFAPLGEDFHEPDEERTGFATVGQLLDVVDDNEEREAGRIGCLAGGSVNVGLEVSEFGRDNGGVYLAVTGECRGQLLREDFGGTSGGIESEPGRPEFHFGREARDESGLAIAGWRLEDGKAVTD